MWPLVAVPAKVIGNVGSGSVDRVIRFEEHPLVLNTAPDTLDKHVVSPSAFAVHAQFATLIKHRCRNFCSCALTALVSIDNLGLTEFGECLLKDFYGMTRLQGDGHFVREHLAASYIDHSRQVNKALGHRNVGGVQCPDLVGPDDGQVPEQIRVDLVARLSFAGARLGRKGFYKRLVPALMASTVAQAASALTSATLLSSTRLHTVLDRAELDNRHQAESIWRQLQATAAGAAAKLELAARASEAMVREVAGQGPEKTLKRGFVVVRSSSGHTLTRAASLKTGQSIALEFADGFQQAQVVPSNN